MEHPVDFFCPFKFFNRRIIIIRCIKFSGEEIELFLFPFLLDSLMFAQMTDAEITDCPVEPGFGLFDSLFSQDHPFKSFLYLISGIFPLPEYLISISDQGCLEFFETLSKFFDLILTHGCNVKS